MLDELMAAMSARRGHFLLESGHHGDLGLDVDRLFVRPGLLKPFVRELASRLALLEVEAVCGPLTGGAFLAQMVAEELGVAFVYADRAVNSSRTGLFPVQYPIPPELAEFIEG